MVVAYPDGFAVMEDLKKDMAILATSGREWAERNKRLAAWVPDLDIFSQGLVERTSGRTRRAGMGSGEPAGDWGAGACDGRDCGAERTRRRGRRLRRYGLRQDCVVLRQFFEVVPAIGGDRHHRSLQRQIVRRHQAARASEAPLLPEVARDLYANVEYRDTTSKGLLRPAAFKGLGYELSGALSFCARPACRSRALCRQPYVREPKALIQHTSASTR